MPYLSDLVNEYEVYLIDLPGHIKSDAFDQDLSIRKVAEEVDALAKYLILDKIRAIGLSFGGDVLYQLALLNPYLLASMTTFGALGSWTIKDFPAYHKMFTNENRANFPRLIIDHALDAKIKALMEQFLNYTVYVETNELNQFKPDVLIMICDDDPGMDINEVARTRTYFANQTFGYCQIWLMLHMLAKPERNLSKRLRLSLRNNRLMAISLCNQGPRH